MNTLQVLETWLKNNEGIPVEVRKVIEKEVNTLTRKTIRETEKKKVNNKTGKNSKKKKSEEDSMKAFLEMAKEIGESRMRNK